MKTVIESLIVLALAANICMPGVASAYLTGGTWMETGAETGYTPFTKIEVFADASITLTDVVRYGLNAPGWTNSLVNHRYAAAEGPPPGSLRFTWQCPHPGVQYREIEYLVRLAQVRCMTIKEKFSANLTIKNQCSFIQDSTNQNVP